MYTDIAENKTFTNTSNVVILLLRLMFDSWVSTEYSDGFAIGGCMKIQMFEF